MLEKRIRKNADLLSKTLNACKLLDETDLSHLYELHDLYVESLRLAGELMSDALYLKDTAYTTRKHEQARIMLESDGTIAEKQAKAELAVKEFRDQEAQGNYTYTRYKAMHQSIDHKLYDIKAKRAAMERELQR